MKYVVVPEDVHVINKQGKPVMAVEVVGEEPAPWVITHEGFVNDNICANPAISKGGGDGIRRHRKIVQAFADCKPGDVIGVEDADYRIARAVVDNMEWSAGFARYSVQMLPHVEAWESAEKQDDAWKKKRDADAETKATVSAIR